jgi:phenylacetate-coenzyme A ligase PaaK-like adenylate-forming protein
MGADLSALPTMTKAELMANWDEIVTDPRLSLGLATEHLERVGEHGPGYLLDAYHVIASGGSTGLRGVFVWDFEGWLAAAGALLRPAGYAARWEPQPAPGPTVTVAASNVVHMSAAMAATFALPGRTYHLPVTLPLHELVAELNRLQPFHLTGYPSILHELASEAQAGRLHIRPALVQTSSEPLFPAARQAIQTAFDAPVMNMYACSEVCTMAVSYPWGTGLHLLEDVAVLEPVDADGQPVPPGAPASKLLLTNVINQVLPLIRYELTDEVTFLVEPNPGPWTGRRIANVVGRLEDAFRYPGGAYVHPHIFHSAFDRVANIVEYQVRQTPTGADITLVVASPTDLERTRRELEAELVHLGLTEPRASFRIVDRLERQVGTEKLQRFIPLGR